MMLTAIGFVVATAPAQIRELEPHVVVGARRLALSPDGSKLAFTYRGDVWTVDSIGGRAVPVTNNVEMDDFPVWSPDGEWLAFASDRNGNWDIYAVPTAGGATVRLTWSSATETPMSWTPDGEELVFNANYDKGFTGIYRMNVKTLALKEVFVNQYRMDHPMVSPDGKTIAFTHKQNFSYVRPRYEGSAAGQIWTMGLDGSNRKKVRATRQQHLWLQWKGDGSGMYAVTAEEKTPSSRMIDEKPSVFVDNVKRTPNVYEIDLNGRAKRLTSFVGSSTRFLTASSGGKLAFEVDGQVMTMMPGTSPEPIEITATVDPKQGTEQRVVITSGASEAALAPDEKTVVFQARRELFSVPVKRGKGPNGADATQLTDYAGTDDQPVYAPDGKSIFFTSDRDGAKSLYSMNLESKEITIRHKVANDIELMEVTPDKKHLSYWVSGREGGLFKLPLDGGSPERVLDKPHKMGYNFSPDMKYLAYVKMLNNSGFKPWANTTNVWVRELASGKEVNVSRLNVQDRNPAWSSDGKFLYFVSARAGGSIQVLPLQREDARSTEMDLKYTKPTGAVDVKFDMERPDLRLRTFLRGQAGGLMMDKEKGDLYFIRSGDLWKVGYNGEGARAVTSGGGISSLEFTASGNKMFVLKGGVPTIVDIRKPNFQASTVAYRADWRRNLVAEREAAFDEFWRTMNLSFYDEYFHRRDWKKIRERYRPLLGSVGHRYEMALVLNLMVGELEASHSEVSPAPGGNGSESTAHLGFKIDYSHNGNGVKILEVPDNSPGDYEKTKLEAGEYVMTVNGQDVKADQHLWKLLRNQTGRDITLTVNSTPTKTGARTVKYRALSGGAFRGLLARNREEWRRSYVEEKSGGRLTYVHIAGMGGGNLTTFDQEMWEYVQGKDGVIIDVRENGGGNIADILLDMLERKLHMRYVPRDGDEIPGPGQLWDKPTVVMHAESSFSNAEMFPAAMKSLGLAELVGMQTPGYVIYTYGGRLVDGTSIRLPSTGVYRVDGSPTENLGQMPDHMVDIDPSQYFGGEDPQIDKAIEVLLKKLPRK